MASALYKTHAQAHTELARLSVARPGDYNIWKSTAGIKPPQWGHAVVRADWTVVLPGWAARRG